jgi:hypothetical protein
MPGGSALLYDTTTRYAPLKISDPPPRPVRRKVKPQRGAFGGPARRAKR